MMLRGRLTLFSVLALAFLAAAMAGRSHVDGEGAAIDVAAAPPERINHQTTAPEALIQRLPPGARGGSVGSFVEESVGRVIERVPLVRNAGRAPDFFHIEYTIDPELSREVERILRKGRVALGHVLVMDVHSGRMLAYESTDPTEFPATRAYPMASIMKVVTAAGMLRHRPDAVGDPCRYIGSPYRLTRSRLTAPNRGHTATLERALATSNNQCFARFAVRDLGIERVMEEARRTGLLRAPGPGHDPGSIEDAADDLALGRLGSGLKGSWVTPLGALRLGAALAGGELVEPRWVQAIEAESGEALRMPEPEVPAKIWPPGIADRLRGMLIQTTRSGTARRAFRDRRGRPRLGPVRVAGKTGSLSGRDPKGRYEWFVGVAPADAPQIAIAVLVVNGELWWRSSSQIAADVLESIFCKGRECSAEVGADLLERSAARSSRASSEQIGSTGDSSRDPAT